MKCKWFFSFGVRSEWVNDDRSACYSSGREKSFTAHEDDWGSEHEGSWFPRPAAAAHGVDRDGRQTVLFGSGLPGSQRHMVRNTCSVSPKQKSLNLQTNVHHKSVNVVDRYKDDVPLRGPLPWNYMLTQKFGLNVLEIRRWSWNRSHSFTALLLYNTIHSFY